MAPLVRSETFDTEPVHATHIVSLRFPEPCTTLRKRLFKIKNPSPPLPQGNYTAILPRSLFLRGTNLNYGQSADN